MSQEKKIIVYLDDNGEIASVKAIVKELNDSIIVFETDTNLVTIPLSRLLKIKEAKNVP